MVNWTELRKSILGEQKRKLLPAKIKAPMLPMALTKFCRKADDPKASPCDLAAIIESDGGLTCALLRHVNSARVGLRNKASSAQQAMALLGLRNTKLLLMTAAVQNSLGHLKSKLVNLTLYSHANLERALFARELAVRLKADADVAYAGAMLQDFLLPVLADELTNDYKQFLDLQRTNPTDFIKLEQEKFGWNHAYAAANIMWDWGFPDDLICAVLFHHRGLEMLIDKDLGKTAVAAVAVASLLPEPWNQCPSGIQQLRQLEAAWPALKLAETAVQVETEFRSMSDSDYQLCLMSSFAMEEACA